MAGMPSGVAGTFDHRVRASEVGEEPLSRRDRALGIVGQVRVDLQGREAVRAASVFVHGPEQVSGGLDVFDGERFERVLGCEAGFRVGDQGDVVVVARRHMAFSKIVGFEVRPVTPESMSRWSSPLPISARYMLSYQTLCPCWRSACSELLAWDNCYASGRYVDRGVTYIIQTLARCYTRVTR